MTFFLKTLRYYIDYLAIVLLFILPILVGYFTADNYYSNDGDVRFFISSITTVGLWTLIGLAIQAMVDVDNESKPKNKYKLEIKGNELNERFSCVEYTIDHNTTGQIILTMDGVISELPIGTAILVTEIE